MSPVRWETVKRLFHEVLERPTAERDAYLAQAADDPALADEVSALLSAHGHADDTFLSHTHTGQVPTLAAGTRLGPYEIVSLIGAGGMGEVYKGRDTRLDRTVAIKVLPEEIAPDPDRQRRFEHEARVVSKLNHPHICALYDVGKQDGRSFLVMEYVEGEGLDRRLARGTLPLPEALRYAAEIADAVAEAHRQGIVHRDIKPANVMVTARGAKVLDFGLAKLAAAGIAEPAADTQTAAPRTKSGMVVGTVPYMSPEQAQGKPVDARSDVFAFGAVLYELITGRRAFAASSDIATMNAILNTQPRPAGECVRGVPSSLDHVVFQCLRKDPSRRIQRMEDVKIELDQIREDVAVKPRPLWWRRIAAATLVAVVVAAADATPACAAITATPERSSRSHPAATSPRGSVRTRGLPDERGLLEPGPLDE